MRREGRASPADIATDNCGIQESRRGKESHRQLRRTGKQTGKGKPQTTAAYRKADGEGKATDNCGVQ